MGKHLVSLFSGKDNASLDIVRVSLPFSLAGWGALVFFGHDAMATAGAIATILTAHCAGMKLKETTEPGTK